MTPRLSGLNNHRMELSSPEKEELHLGMVNLRCVLGSPVELVNRQFTVGVRSSENSFMLDKTCGCQQKNDIRNHETGCDHKGNKCS